MYWMKQMLTVIVISCVVIWACSGPGIVVSDRVVIVTTTTGHGSGFVIAPDRVMTAKHCIDPNGVSIAGRKVERVILDPDSDLAVIVVSPPFDVKPLRLCTRPLRRGERVTVVGFPYDLPVCVFKGYVVAVDCDVSGCLMDVFDVYAGPGCSGGPVVDESGEVRAVWTMYDTRMAVTYAVPVGDWSK